MGFFMELISDIFIEGIIEFFGYCYLQLMQLIVPDKTVSERARKNIKIVATTIAALLFAAVIVGLSLFVQEDPFTSNIGKYVLGISVSIMALQVLLGITMRIVNRFRK